MSRALGHLTPARVSFWPEAQAPPHLILGWVRAQRCCTEILLSLRHWRVSCGWGPLSGRLTDGSFLSVEVCHNLVHRPLMVVLGSVSHLRDTRKREWFPPMLGIRVPPSSHPIPGAPLTSLGLRAGGFLGRSWQPELGCWWRAASHRLGISRSCPAMTLSSEAGERAPCTPAAWQSPEGLAQEHVWDFDWPGPRTPCSSVVSPGHPSLGVAVFGAMLLVHLGAGRQLPLLSSRSFSFLP